MINQIIAHLTDPAVWGVISQAFNTPDDQATLRLYHKNPTAMQAMLIAELEQKLAQNPALRAQFAAILADDAPAQTWHIEGQNVGMVNMPQANFQGAQNVTITGLNMPSPLPLSPWEKGNDSLAQGERAGVREDPLAPWERAGVREDPLAPWERAGVREDPLAPWERAGVRENSLAPWERGRGEGKLATMSDDEIIIFCYDNAHHLYAQLPHNRATLRRELLAYLEGKK